MKNLVIVGAGGHGLVVAETAELMQVWDKIYFMDPKFPEPTILNEIEVLPEQDFLKLPQESTDVFIAVGDNAQRLNLLNFYADQGYNCPAIVHPEACVSRSVSIAMGTVVMAKAVINAKAIIGKGCIINSAAVIEHQCVLASGVHVSPNACLAGNVTVGLNAWIAAGAIVINNIHIGHEVIVGAGSVVINDVAAKQRVVGVPARRIEVLEEKK